MKLHIVQLSHHFHCQHLEPRTHPSLLSTSSTHNRQEDGSNQKLLLLFASFPPSVPPSHPHCFPSSSPCPFARTPPAWSTPQGMSGHFTATVLTLQLNFLIESMTCDGKVRCKKESTHHSIPQDVNEGPATLGDYRGTRGL